MTQEPAAQTSSAAWELDAAPSIARRGFGVTRVFVGLLVLAAIATQITDQLLNGAFVAREYFSYFTIQTSLINVVVLVAAGILALRRPTDPELLTTVRVSILAYAVVTGGVYAALLRGIESDGFVGIQWPNEVIHVVVPIYIAVDFLLAPWSPAIAWRRLFFVVAYPLAWVGFTLVRGAVTGWYPYPFLEPAGPDGVGGVVLYVLGIAVFIIGVAAVAIGVTRSRAALRDRRA